MKKLFFVVLALSFVLTAVAKEKDNKSDKSSEKPAVIALSGMVTDMVSGESLVGVEVKLDGTDKKTYTDFDGNFTFENIKPGEYNVIATYISYEKSKVKITDVGNKNNQVNIKLQSSL